MKTLTTFFVATILIFALQTTAFAQSSVTETLKQHFNQTVQSVNETDDAVEKRAILNESFNKMIAAIDRIETMASLTEEESEMLKSYKFGLTEKLSELNGLDGFNEISDEDLDEFSSFSQDYIEQADRTVTIGITTVLLILIILLLL